MGEQNGFLLKNDFSGKTFSMTKERGLKFQMVSSDGERCASLILNIFHIYPYPENIFVWGICIAEHLLMHQCEGVVVTAGEIQRSCAA